MVEAEVGRELERCFKARDREKAVGTILAAVDAGLSIDHLYTRVLSPFLDSVGRGWQEGETSVWEEHLIVDAVRTAIDALYPRVLREKAGISRIPRTVGFFCPPDEVHDVGLRMLAHRFDLRGFHTVFIGAMTPLGEIVKCAGEMGLDVVCLSASSHLQRAGLRNLVRHLGLALPDVRIVVGGPAFSHSDDGWENYTVESVDSLLDALEREGLCDSGGEERSHGNSHDFPHA